MLYTVAPNQSLRASLAQENIERKLCYPSRALVSPKERYTPIESCTVDIHNSRTVSLPSTSSHEPDLERFFQNFLNQAILKDWLAKLAVLYYIEYVHMRRSSRVSS